MTTLYHNTAQTQGDKRELDDALVALARAIANRAARPVSVLLCGWCRRAIEATQPPVASLDLCARCSKQVPS